MKDPRNREKVLQGPMIDENTDIQLDVETCNETMLDADRLQTA